MTTPSSGVLFFSQIMAELGQTGLFFIDRIDARTLAQANPSSSTPIHMGQFYTRTGINGTCNIGNTGSQYGFIGGLTGAIFPTSARGVAISLLATNTGLGTVELSMASPVAADYFYALMIRNTTNTIDGTLPDQILKMSDATWNGTNKWTWNSQILAGWAAAPGANRAWQLVY